MNVTSIVITYTRFDSYAGAINSVNFSDASFYIFGVPRYQAIRSDSSIFCVFLHFEANKAINAIGMW